MALQLKPAEEQFIPFTLSPSPEAAVLDVGVPATSALPSVGMKMFGSNPLKSEMATVACPNCQKPVLQSAMMHHSEQCKLIEQQGTVKKTVPAMGAPIPPSTTNPATASTAPMAASPEDSKKPAKKRKASEMEASEPPGGDPSAGGPPAKKRAKPTPRVTKGRAKGPVDVDRQCGVINDKGLPCSRSLSCKSHSMGAKRAVPGRSKDYDVLLLEWNRAHKPNFVEPVKKPTKEEKKEKKEREKAEKAAAKAAEKAEAAAAALAAGEKTKKGTGVGGNTTKKKKPKVEFVMDVAEEEQEVLNALEQEDEVDALVNAVQTLQRNGYGAKPLAVPIDADIYFLQRRERLLSSNDLLIQALQGW